LPDKDPRKSGENPHGSQVNYQQYKQDALELEVVPSKKFLMDSITEITT